MSQPNSNVYDYGAAPSPAPVRVDLLIVTRFIAVAFLLLSPLLFDDLSVTLSAGFAFTGLCCLKD